MSKTALVVIDLQNDYFPGGRWTLSKMDEAADNAAQVIGRVRQRGDLIVHVRHENQMPEAPFFVAGTHGAEIHPKVAPLDSETVIIKHFPSSFRGTDLEHILQHHEITDLIVCGAMSQMCVDSTVRAAADLGYRCTVIHDACAAHDTAFEGVAVPAAGVHASFMSSLSMAFAVCRSTKEFLAT